MQFIGGFSARQAERTVRKLLGQNVVPIVDYAKEGATKRSDVEKYIKNIVQLSESLGHNPSIVLALKLSSFLPSQNFAHDIVSTICSFNSRTGCTKFMLDAETPGLKTHEDRTYNTVCDYVLNKGYHVTIYKTIQAYRRDSYDEMVKFIDEPLPCHGVKLVRGAYWDGACPEFFKSKLDTDSNYNTIMEHLLTKYDKPVCIATHNDLSIKQGTSLLKAMTNYNVSFAQLLGMRDDITYTLNKQGFQTMKYVPYGSIIEMTPYLIRRFIENREAMIDHMFFSGKKS